MIVTSKPYTRANLQLLAPLVRFSARLPKPLHAGTVAILSMWLTLSKPGGQTPHPTPFAELDHLLDRFVGRVRSILADELVGVYLTGSFALGGGDEASDCDFLVVTGNRVSHSEERELRELHAEILTWPGYWAYNLEGSYAPKADLQSLGALGRPWLYVDRGSREMEWSAHCNTADVRWILAERPLVVAGVDPGEFTCKVPVSTLRREMRPQIESFLADLATWASFDVSWTQRYAVEASIRMLYTLERGEVIAKQDALRWAKTALAPEWHDLIDQVRQDRFVQWNDPPRPGSADRSIDFVHYIRERARGERGATAEATGQLGVHVVAPIDPQALVQCTLDGPPRSLRPMPEDNESGRRNNGESDADPEPERIDAALVDRQGGRGDKQQEDDERPVEPQAEDVAETEGTRPTRPVS